MFPVFHLAGSTCRATKTFVAGGRKLLRKVEYGSTLSNKFWLCCSFFIKLTTWHVTNLLALWQINQSERCISSTRNKCFCCGSNWSCRVKHAKHRPKLAMKQCCATSWGFVYLVFRRLKWSFNPGLASTGFQTIPPSFRQVNLTWARDPIETSIWSADHFQKTCDLDKL